MFESYKPRNYNQNFLKAEKGLKIQSFRNRGAKKAIPKVSKRRLADNKIYEIAKTTWRKERESIDNFKCEFVETNGVRCSARASPNPHHKKRRGRYLSDARWFMAVCNNHHRWIEENGREAEKRGYLIREFKNAAEHGNAKMELGKR